MSEFDGMYVVAGLLLIAVIAFGLWRINVHGKVRRDPHSGLTEVEEARRKTLH